MAAMGEWERWAAGWWVYRRPDEPHAYGHVRRHRDDGPHGAAWDALALDERPEDEIIAEGVSLEEAKAALQRHAAGDDVG